MGWISKIVGSAAGLLVTGLSYEARKNDQQQKQYVDTAKLQLQHNVNVQLSDPANHGLSAKDIVDKAMQGVDESKFSSGSTADIKDYLIQTTGAIQEKMDIQNNQAVRQASVNSSLNLMNQLRNHVTSGDTSVKMAENLYDHSVKEPLQNHLSPEEFDVYDRNFKSQIRLDALKNMSPTDAGNALQQPDFINNMTNTDYQTAHELVKSKHAHMLADNMKMIGVQQKLAEDVIKGNFTPNELNEIMQRDQGMDTDALTNVVHTFSAIKNMTVPELQQILEPPSQQKDSNGNPLPIDQMRAKVDADDNYRALIKSRIHTVQTETQKDLVGFAASNGELTPLDISNSLALKTSIAKRTTEVVNLERKYQVRAKGLFTTTESNAMRSAFAQSPYKSQVLLDASKSLPLGNYSEADSMFYHGAGADLYSLKEGAIDFANDSYRGYQISQTSTTKQIHTKTQDLITNEVKRFMPLSDVKGIKSMSRQIDNVLLARGIKTDTLESSDIDDLITESTNTVLYPQKSTLGIFAQHDYILAPDAQRAKIVSTLGHLDHWWNKENQPRLFKQLTGGVDLADLQLIDGSKLTSHQLETRTVLRNLTPTTYTMVYTDSTGHTSAVFDKQHKPIVIDSSKITQADIDSYNKPKFK